MKQVTKFETLDGKLHNSLDAAVRHAEKNYGDGLTHLANLALRQEKYTAMCKFIDENLLMFERLSLLKADIELTIPEGE